MARKKAKKNPGSKSVGSKSEGSKSAGAKIKNCKLRGEWTELCFMLRAMEQGLCFSKPWGEIKGYDFAVERGGRFVRVQVKSTICRKPEGGFSCTLKDSHGKYRGNPFDFLAAYVMPDDTWFIIPGRKVRGMSNVSLYPHSKRAKYTPYQEAWHLLRDKNAGNHVDRIMACVEEADFWGAAAHQVP